MYTRFFLLKLKGVKRLFLLLCISCTLLAEQSLEELFQALETSAYWDMKLYERFPTTYNHLLATGYFVTHSARMTQEGEMSLGFAHAPPYLNWNARIQPFSQLAFSLNYRIFCGVEDSFLSPYGFGNYADRGANFKYALFTPEQSLYQLPGIAFGVDDFMGSKKFTNYYAVCTKVWRDYGVETSLGWGSGIYTKGPSKGFFGAVNWFALQDCKHQCLQKTCLSAEYDPINYKKDPHPNAHPTHFPLNFGIHYQFADIITASLSCIHANQFAFSGSLQCDFGKINGLFPKIQDPLPYTSPKDTQPLGCMRTEQVMIQTINYALEQQGFKLTNAWMEHTCDQKRKLWIRLINCRYRQEHAMKIRLQNLFASLAPSNVSQVIIIIESYGLACQKYIYHKEILTRYTYHGFTDYAMNILSPKEEVSYRLTKDLERIFQKRYDLYQVRISPRFESFFGNARGKFQYDAGVQLDLEGFLPRQWFYQIQLSQTLFSSIRGISDFDLFHPSQLPNVATDYIRYRQTHALNWDQLYLQKSWNFGKGLSGRISGGYFQINYGGIAAECLWYPVNSCVAIGLQGAVVKKRRFSGLGFQSTLRHFEKKTPVWRSYQFLEQYFLDVYLDIPSFSIIAKISLGQFLARDKGARLEMTRYFSNGVRMTGWMTYTDACDQIHGENYYDRGVSIEIPFDFFYKRSSKRILNYGMAAWLRDAGYTTMTGKTLFEILNQERRF